MDRSPGAYSQRDNARYVPESACLLVDRKGRWGVRRCANRCRQQSCLHIPIFTNSAQPSLYTAITGFGARQRKATSVYRIITKAHVWNKSFGALRQRAWWCYGALVRAAVSDPIPFLFSVQRSFRTSSWFFSSVTFLLLSFLYTYSWRRKVEHSLTKWPQIPP